jgi:hypothetical protein
VLSACPKCGATIVADTSACKKCGLAVAKMASFAATREAAAPEPLVRAWELAVDEWSNTARHEEVLRLITQNDAYAWGAAKYRSRAGDPIADKFLERVRKSAEATMMTSAAARNVVAKNPYRNTIAMLVIVSLAIAGALIYAYLKSNKPQPTPPSVEGQP